MKLAYFIIYLGTIVIFIAFIFSLLPTKKHKPSYYNYITFFILGGLFLSVNAIYSINITVRLTKAGFLIQQSIIFLQFIFLVLFFLKILEGFFKTKVIKIFIYLSIFTEFILLVTSTIENKGIYANTMSNLFLLFLSFFYFKDLLQNKPKLLLTIAILF